MDAEHGLHPAAAQLDTALQHHPDAQKPGVLPRRGRDAVLRGQSRHRQPACRSRWTPGLLRPDEFQRQPGQFQRLRQDQHSAHLRPLRQSVLRFPCHRHSDAARQHPAHQRHRPHCRGRHRFLGGGGHGSQRRQYCRACLQPGSDPEQRSKDPVHRRQRRGLVRLPPVPGQPHPRDHRQGAVA